MLSIDIETSSKADIEKCGAFEYARHPSTVILCGVWDLDGKRGHFKRRLSIPAFVADYIRAGLPVSAFNAAFDVEVWNRFANDVDVPRINPKQVECSQARASYYGYSGGLDSVAEQLGLPLTKDKDGYHLMLKLSKGDRIPPDAITDSDMDRLVEYCYQDVAVEVALNEKLPSLPPFERDIWISTYRINKYGIPIDLETVNKIITEAQIDTQRRVKEITELTNGVVTAPTQTKRIKEMLAAEGLHLESLSAEVLEDLDLSQCSELARKLIELRLSGSLSSLAKYTAMNHALDGRLLGTLRYYGANTGRWSGAVVQPQNMPQGSHSESDIANFIETVGTDINHYLFPSFPAIASSALRAMIKARPRHKFICADLSNIESRLLVWFAEEEWAVQAFRDFDAGIGKDVYVKNYQTAFKCDEQTAEKNRFVGKTLVLACGYGGWVGAWRKSDKSNRFSDDEVARFISAWRRANPNIVKLWERIELAVRAALITQSSVQVNCVTISVKGDTLRMALPSGRSVYYTKVKLQGNEICYNKGGIQTKTYGASIVQTLVQAMARDVIATAMLRLHAQDIDIVTLVHDESLCEVQTNSAFSVYDLTSVMTKDIDWLKGCPLAAKGWEGQRFKK